MRQVGLLLFLACGVGVLGCGQTTLIDPNADLKFRIDLERAQRFVVPGDDREYLQLDLFLAAQSLDPKWPDAFVFKGLSPSETYVLPRQNERRLECNASWCFVLVMPPGSLPDNTEEIMLEVPELEHRIRVPLVVRTLPFSWSLTAQSLEDNAKVLVSAQDPLRQGAGLRFFDGSRELVRLPGLCGDSPKADDPRWTSERSFPAEVDPVFSDEGNMCIWMRPPLPPNGSAVAALSIPARAVIRRFQHSFSPTPDRSPIVYGFIFDLEIPDPVRCRSTQERLRERVRLTAEADAVGTDYAVEVVELPEIQVAVDDGVLCRQTDRRSINGTQIIAQTHALVTERFGNERVRTVWIYVNNLNLALPAGVIDGLEQIRGTRFDDSPDRPPGFASDRFVFSVAAEIPMASFLSDAQLRWVSSDDPTFLDSIDNSLKSFWPFTTLDHDPLAHVPLLTADEAMAVEAFRVCSSGTIQAFGEPLAGDVFAPGPLGPGFTARIPQSLLVPENAFVPEIRQFSWEACVGLCDRPGPNQPPTAAWIESLGCP